MAQARERAVWERIVAEVEAGLSQRAAAQRNRPSVDVWRRLPRRRIVRFARCVMDPAMIATKTRPDAQRGGRGAPRARRRRRARSAASGRRSPAKLSRTAAGAQLDTRRRRRARPTARGSRPTANRSRQGGDVLGTCPFVEGELEIVNEERGVVGRALCSRPALASALSDVKRGRANPEGRHPISTGSSRRSRG